MLLVSGPGGLARTSLSRAAGPGEYGPGRTRGFSLQIFHNGDRGSGGFQRQRGREC